MNESNCGHVPRVLLLALISTAGCTASVDKQWLQWGGPNRDFCVKTAGLADSWPGAGPKKIWHRPLGDGYSAILLDGDRLYTMYRTGEEECTISLDAEAGSTIWEHCNPSPFTEDMSRWGPGPHSTPLVSDQRVYTIGTNAVLHCFEKKPAGSCGNVISSNSIASSPPPSPSSLALTTIVWSPRSP